MRRLGHTFAAVASLTIISYAVSSENDPSLFLLDDSSSFATDAGTTLGNVNVLSQPNSILDQTGLDFGAETSWDAPWLTFDNLFGPGFLEASCSNDNPQILRKTRHRRGICIQGETTNTPPVLGLPNLLELEQPMKAQSAQEEDLKKVFGLDAVGEEQNHECPPPYDKHLCCEGPGIQTHPDSGIYDVVQKCSACSFWSIYRFASTNELVNQIALRAWFLSRGHIRVLLQSFSSKLNSIREK